MLSKHLSILLVEDNHALAHQIMDFFEGKSIVMDYASNGKEATQLIAQVNFDLVILDLMLPDIDGYQLCCQLKNQTSSHLPILMLTARDSLQDKLRGFEVGADDYLTKPFALEELQMRCLALSRRVMLHQDKSLVLGELTIDIGRRSVVRETQAIDLSQTEFDILEALVLAHPNALSKRELNSKIWGDEQPETDVLRSHIYTLRNALDKPFNSSIIKTVHGIGFKLEVGE